MKLHCRRHWNNWWRKFNDPQIVIPNGVRNLLSRTASLALKEPVHAVFVGKMPIAAERHVAQVIEQVLICSFSETVKNLSQFAICPAIDVHRHGIALFR